MFKVQKLVYIHIKTNKIEKKISNFPEVEYIKFEGLFMHRLNSIVYFLNFDVSTSMALLAGFIQFYIPEIIVSQTI